MEITKNKITDIFCFFGGFCQEYDKDDRKNELEGSCDGRRYRKRPCTMSRSEIMTILVCFHFNQFRNFKHYYPFYVREDRQGAHLPHQFCSFVFGTFIDRLHLDR